MSAHECRLPAHAIGDQIVRRCPVCHRLWRWVMDLRHPHETHGGWYSASA